MSIFSANLGFLWSELSLADAIRAAHRNNFDAVECHFPYNDPIDDVYQALEDTGLPMLGLNTIRGPLNAGLAALPEQETDARRAIEQAFEYGARIGCQNVHVMAGASVGPEATKTYLNNLRYASDIAGKHSMSVLIEPLNPFDVPGYFLRDTVHASELLDALNLDNVRLMFDIYHVGRTEGQVIERFNSCLPLIGHIQFASVPDRGPPGHGEIDFDSIFNAIDRSGWCQPLGAEYKVSGSTEDTLGWMRSYKHNERQQ
ncbi:TIM barrel protein [Litoricolaceae bacterium]|nr:TIM barrel protein [Litorivicinaceae bacterium]